MSFFFQTYEIPLWFLVFAFACAAPLWIRWYKAFYKKFIVTGILERKLRKAASVAEEQVDIIKKATDNWNASSDPDAKAEEAKKARRQHLMTEADQPYVKIVLKTLALSGDAGMLLQSISDKLNIGNNEIKSSLSYLEKNEFIEIVPTASGTKYYLAARGKRYCIKRGYITE